MLLSCQKSVNNSTLFVNLIHSLADFQKNDQKMRQKHKLMEGIITNVYDRIFFYVQKCTQWRKWRIWQKNRQMAAEKLIKAIRGALYRVEKLTKMAKLANIGHRFGKCSNWMAKVVSFRVAVMTRIANMAKSENNQQRRKWRKLAGAPCKEVKVDEMANMTKWRIWRKW